MTSPADVVLDILLRAVALFYAAGSFVGVRRIAMDALLDRAIAAIGGQAEDRDEGRLKIQRWGALFNMGLLVLGGIGGILVAAMIGAGAAVVTAVALLNGINLFYLAPRFFDAVEPPDAQERQHSYKAAIVYALFALAALFHWRRGGMTSFADTNAIVLACAGFAAVAFVVHAARTWMASQSLEGPAAPAREPYDDAAWQEKNEAELRRIAEERRQECARYDGLKFIFSPALFAGSPFVVAETGERLRDWPPISELDDDDLNAQYDLSWSLERALDPDDPMRRRFRSDEARDAFMAEARALFERARDKMGADRLTFDADFSAYAPSRHPARIVLQARGGWGSLVLDGDDDVRSWGDDLGISLQLEKDIAAWAADFVDGCQRDDADDSPLRPPAWNDDERAAFDARGRTLAERVRREFAATGRDGVEIGYATWKDG